MKKAVYLMLLLWIMLVCGIIVYNETILTRGQEVLLKITPVDPRDFLRGDYISLRYEINTLPQNITQSSIYKHHKAYVLLEQGDDGTYRISSVSVHKPAKGVFLSAEIYGSRIYYPGISKYFVKEGEAKKLEAALQQGGLAKISAGRNGSARIKEIVIK